jgi:formylglycine-generating enzyme required for sulfatase activity
MKSDKKTKTIMPLINYYKILEIKQTSDPTIIRAAFNKLAMQYHPDRNIGDASAEVMMKILNEAIAVLSQPRLRKAHDKKLAEEAGQSFVDNSYEDIPKTLEVDLGESIKLDLMLIPEGTFKMGSLGNGRYENDMPRHEVTLTNPFYMGKYAVTQEQWQAVMSNNISYFKGGKMPVNQISWNDCKEFIKKLNAKTDGGYRLPTEAEWEYACRAGTTTEYSYGDTITPKNANYDESNIGKPIAVGSYKPNAFGLYDMHGNVWEWCEDWYGGYPGWPVEDPKGPAVGQYRILRGGSFAVNSSRARSCSRIVSAPAVRIHVNGFRLVKDE